MKSKDELKDLKVKDIAQLSKLLHEKRDTLIKLNLDNQFGKDKNVAQLGKLKKTIARIETIINEKITIEATKSAKSEVK